MMETKTAVGNMESILDGPRASTASISVRPTSASPMAWCRSSIANEPEILKIYEKNRERMRQAAASIPASTAQVGPTARCAPSTLGFKLVTLSNEKRTDDDLRQDAGEPDPERLRRKGVEVCEIANREVAKRGHPSCYSLLRDSPASLFAHFKETPHDPSTPSFACIPTTAC